MDVLILSKDRAAQLDLLLNSIYRNFPIYNKIFVNYATSNNEYQAGYDYLQQFHADVCFIPENDVKSCLFSTLDMVDDHVLLLTDDTIIYRKDDNLEALSRVFRKKGMLNFSLRMGKNVCIQDYKTGELLILPNDFEEQENILIWNWYEYRPILNNWGFPYSPDGSIWKVSEFRGMINFDWANLRVLEGELALNRRNMLMEYPLMSCFKQSIAVNIPCNSVQPGLYASDKYYQTPSDMNQKFLKGGRLSLDKTDFSNILGSHQEVELKWE
jgi:hypothetical protein